MLNEDQITRFRAIYRNRFGRELGKEDAHECATRLITLFNAIIPVTEIMANVKSREVADVHTNNDSQRKVSG